MDTEIESSRPNIRIEIVNNVSQPSEEKMDVDNEANENEEGEISDDNMEDKTLEEASQNKLLPEINAIFTTGINIFDKKEQEKLQERAKRFALKPDEIRSFTDEDLHDLYYSLGINPTNESEVKFETLHLLGLDEMGTEDVVNYFSSYAPEGVEWIDSNSCNVVWLDSASAARALHFKSKVVRGMPARESKDIFPKEFLDIEEPQLENGQSILVQNQNREIELQNEVGEILLPKKKVFPKNSVDISEIVIPIPPGYWRLGEDHPKSRCLLIRFGMVTDKLPYRSEKCSKYYKILSNPSQRNVISESKKKELRTLFERNKELNQSKNPWGSLAKNWDKDSKYREREPVMYLDKEEEDVQIVEVKNPKLQARLGLKRKLEEPEEGKPTEENVMQKDKKVTKAPRMKMYADEEEENQKRRKILLSIKKQTEEFDRRHKEDDLRNMLGPNNRLLLKKDTPPQQVDLGTKLKNRSQRMVFAVDRDQSDLEHYEDHRDIRKDLVEKRHLRERERLAALADTMYMRSISEEKRKDLIRRRTPERTLRSDLMRSSRAAPSRRRRSYSPEHLHDGKTRSKVSVVVKAPRKPTVASTIWSKVKQSSDTENSSSESESDSNNSRKSSSSSSSDSKSESNNESDSSSRSSNKRIAARNPDRPGFDHNKLRQKINQKSPLKITTANEHFTRKRSRKF